jgi:hypothetical protein
VAFFQVVARLRANLSELVRAKRFALDFGWDWNADGVFYEGIVAQSIFAIVAVGLFEF